MTVSAVNPWRTALLRDCRFPLSVVGPVLLCALRRLASICLSDAIGGGLLNWLRLVIWASFSDPRLTRCVTMTVAITRLC